MGCCISDPVEPIVQRELDVPNKVLILGSYGSGKTTLYKQLRYIHGDGYSDTDKQSFQNSIWVLMVGALQTMIKILEDEDFEYNLFDDEAERKQTLSLVNLQLHDSFDFILNMEPDGQASIEMSDQLVHHIKRLWNDRPFQIVFDKRYKVSAEIYDSTEHFMNNIERVCDKNYIPTDEDVLMWAYPTYGMHERVFKIGSNPDLFRFVDAGGFPNGLYVCVSQ